MINRGNSKFMLDFSNKLCYNSIKENAIEKGVPMSDKDFLLETLLGDIMKVAKVNISTGEYSFIKKLDTEIEKRCLQEPTINRYIKATVKEGVIHPQDIADFLRFININHIREQIDAGKRHFAHSYRRRFGKIYTWITFVLSVPQSYSEQNPWVIFRWEVTDDDHHMLEDSLRMLSSVFHKILKINLTEDSYVIIKGYEDEMNQKQGFDEKISAWLRQFALCGNVHEEDRQAFLKFADMDTMREHFRNSNEYMRIRYRRKTEGSFRWVTMELVPSIEYSDDNQVVMLYIRDIQDEYVSELHYQKELEYYCNTDIMTGLWNRYYYNRYAQHLARRNISCLGIVFADLNGLKRINDQKGHTEGDAYIKGFSSMLAREFGKEFCCRISGDEFLVWQEDVDKQTFENKVQHFRESIDNAGRPTASIGTAWRNDLLDADQMVKDAELAMYREKQKYYDKFPEERR